MGECDHEWFWDHHGGGKRFMTCFCYCGLCYDNTLRLTEGNGCIDEDCFCRNQPNEDCRSYTAAHIYDTGAIKLSQGGGKPIEPVVHDLPENPGKTGTCRVCKGPTYRKGDRGRFPVMCDTCKNK